MRQLSTSSGAYAKAAIPIGVRTIPVLSANSQPAEWRGVTGRITSELITSKVPDFADRHFYISGPNAMVDATKKMLQDMGIHRKKIVTDHFSGY